MAGGVAPRRPSPGRRVAHRWTFRLRPTLLTVVLGLLLATVAVIGAIAFVKTADSIDSLVRQQFTAVVRATVARVQSLVEGVPSSLREYELLAQRGVLPIDDKQALGAVFVERLRQNPKLAWIGFGDARDGSFVGATDRSGSGITLYSARPDVRGGVPVETLVERSGRRTIVPGEETAPYTVTEKDWFRKAMALEGFGWLDPYTFTDGRHGVTAALPLRMPGADAPVGVLHIDLFTDSIDEFLDGLAVGASGRVELLTRDGAVVARPTAWRKGDATLDAAVGSIAGGLDGIRGAGRALEFTHAGTAYRASLVPLGMDEGPDWIVAVLAPEAEFTGVAVRNAWWTLGAGFAALLLASLVATVVSARIAVPLRQISEDLVRVASFDFGEAPPPPSFVREVAVVGQTVAHMKSSLRAFGRYVPDEVVRDLLASGHEAELGGERRRLTIHFSDIAGFTSIAERLPPERMVDELGDYFTLMRAVLRSNQGTLDKYMGDGILAFFNAPLDVADHEVKACRAALEAQERLAEDRRARAAAGRPAFHVRIGLAVGDVVVGNIGTPERFAYTVIGDAVNLASRLEGLNKFYGSAILATAELAAATGGAFAWRRLDRVAVVGRTAGTDVAELLARAGELSDDARAGRDAYEVALDDYLAGRFAAAAAGFQAAGRMMPDDTAAPIMARRAAKLARRPPETEWTGVYVHALK